MSSGEQGLPWWPLPTPCAPADMGTLEITRGRQALELRSNLSERRALTDPIRPPGQDESSARNLQWAKAHGESWPACHKLLSRAGTAQEQKGCEPYLLGSSHLLAQSHQPGDRSTPTLG